MYKPVRGKNYKKNFEMFKKLIKIETTGVAFIETEDF
jgi:hypothetical protein